MSLTKRQLYYYIILGVETICLWLIVLSYFNINFKIQEMMNVLLLNIGNIFRIIVLLMLLIILTWAVVQKLKSYHSIKVKQLNNSLNILTSYSLKLKKIQPRLISISILILIYVVVVLIFLYIKNENISYNYFHLLIQSKPQVFAIVSFFLIFNLVSIQNNILLFTGRILIELKPYYNPDPTAYWHWIKKRIFTYIIVGSVAVFSSRFVLSNIGLLNNSNLNSTSTRYMLSALIQSEAAIVAIVITLSLVAVQQTASSYSPRVIDVFKKNPDFWILTISYIIAIIYGLGVLENIKGNDENIIYSDFVHHIEMSYFLGIFVFFSLVLYILSTLNLLKPHEIINILSEKITKQNLLLNVGENPKGADKSDDFTMYLILIISRKPPSGAKLTVAFRMLI